MVCWKNSTALLNKCWQVPMKRQSKQLTAFTTPVGLFQFTTMPFGSVNAPATFSRLMRKLLQDMDDVDNFIDDIMVLIDTCTNKIQNENRITKCILKKKT